MIKKYFAVTLVTASMLIVGCSSDDDTPADPMTPTDPAATPGEGGTAYDTIVGRADMATLRAAIDAVPGLADTLDNPANTFTIFAPNDAAFTALEESNPDDEAIAALLAAPDTLSPILTYHVISGAVDSTAAASAVGTPQVTVNGATVDLAVSATAPTGLSINGADILEADQAPAEGGIGIVHVIAAVLTPPAVEPEPEPPVTTGGDTGTGTPGAGPNLAALESAGNFSTFLSALDPLYGTGSLDNDGDPWTVFVPTNAAIDAAGGASAVTQAILNNHIVTGLGALDAATLLSAGTVTAFSENAFSVGGTADALTINGLNATVVSNTAGGIVYSLDGVLVNP